MSSSLVQIRVDDDLKNETTAILDDIGLDLPTAVRIFFKKVVSVKGIPFEVRKDESPEDSGNRRWAAFEALRQEAQKNNVPEMSLDEINKEIEASRAARSGK